MNLGLSAEQIETRRRYICAGDAELILSGNWSLLYRIKKGLEDEADFYDGLSWHVKRNVSREQMELRRLLGLYTEPFNLAYCERQTGRRVDYFSDNLAMQRAWGHLAGKDAFRPELQISSEYPFMACHLDGMTTTPQGEPMVIDAKMLSRASDVETLRYTGAGTHQATVMGTDYWGLSIIAGGKWEPIIQRVDPIFRAQLIAAEQEFWDYVTRGEEPEDRGSAAEPPKPQPKYREVRVPLDNDEMRDVLIRQNNWLPDALKAILTFLQTEGAAKAHAISRKKIDEAIPEDVGLLEYGRYTAKRSSNGALRQSAAKLEEEEC